MFCIGAEIPGDRKHMSEEDFEKSLQGRQSMDDLKKQIQSITAAEEQGVRDRAMQEIAKAEESMGFPIKQ